MTKCLELRHVVPPLGLHSTPSVRFAHCALRLPGGSLRSPPLPGRHAPAEVQRRCDVDRRVLLALALRAALVAVLASLALAGCAGCASARSGDTPWVAGVGFAFHRLAHRAMHDPPRRCLRLCARSCGARPHFAPHHAWHDCPHRCGRVAFASGSVLRTTACGSGRTARRSRAAAAPLHRVPRRRFPFASPRIPAPTGRRSALVAHTPRIFDAKDERPNPCLRSKDFSFQTKGCYFNGLSFLSLPSLRSPPRSGHDPIANPA